MAIQKPSIPKGTRDFGQMEMARRNYLFDTIRSVFRTYGYQEIQTPAQENLSTLLGKYGEEGDKLLFRIQNSGEKADLAPEKGLRYDLTVPFARYVVQHQNEISFPFKRFQIQPVWRADRPQKGRYREFYQCDVDVIGTRSQVNELELVQMVDAVFGKLGVRVGIHINNRKVLTGFAEIAGAPDKVVDITVAIDKLDKIGIEKVKEEMAEKGLAASGIAVIEQILSLQGGFEEKLAAMKGLFQGGSAGNGGALSETCFRGLFCPCGRRQRMPCRLRREAVPDLRHFPLVFLQRHKDRVRLPRGPGRDAGGAPEYCAGTDLLRENRERRPAESRGEPPLGNLSREGGESLSGKLLLGELPGRGVPRHFPRLRDRARKDAEN